MFHRDDVVRFREGTELAGECYFVAEHQYSPSSAVRLRDMKNFFWANPKDLEVAK